MHVRGNHGGARDLVAAHVDWIMLALVEVAVASGILLFEVRGALAPASLIIIGGWINPVPYLARGFGINAFVIAGGRLQRGLAAIGAASVITLISGLVWITFAVLAS